MISVQNMNKMERTQSDSGIEEKIEKTNGDISEM